MKKYRTKICLVILLISSNINSYSQQKATSKLSELIITISQNDKGIVLESSKGCAWKELKFDSRKEQGIDNFGMNDGVDIDKKLKFYFIIVKTKTGLKLKGVKGMAWRELSFTTKRNKKYQVTQSGVKTL